MVEVDPLAVQLFVEFSRKVLVSNRAERFKQLASNAKKQNRLQQALYHDFESAIRQDVPRASGWSKYQNNPCFAYGAGVGIGRAFDAVCTAYQELERCDGWLIITMDGVAGIYRPGDKWDNETVLEPVIEPPK